MPWEGRVLRQTHQQSCGYCCVGMVANLVDNRMGIDLSIVAMGKRLDPYAYSGATMKGAKAISTSSKMRLTSMKRSLRASVMYVSSSIRIICSVGSSPL